MNLHGVSPTAPSTLRVYRFRHSRIPIASGIRIAKAAIYNAPFHKSNGFLAQFPYFDLPAGCAGNLTGILGLLGDLDLRRCTQGLQGGLIEKRQFIVPDKRPDEREIAFSLLRIGFQGQCKGFAIRLQTGLA